MISSAKSVCTASIIALLLSGCVEGTTAGAGGGSVAASASASSASVTRGKTAEERQLEAEVRDLNQITRNIIVSNTVQGAIVGALGGCILAELTNGNCGRGAVAGGLLGGLAGNTVGRQAAQKKRELVAADETIAKLRGVEARLSGVQASLRAVTRRQNSEIASLRRQVAAGQVSASAAKRRISAINANRTAVIRGLDASRQNVAKEEAQLVRLEQQSGERYTSTKRQVRQTSNRIQSLRNSVALIPN